MAQRRRETYVGPWLPDPIVDDEEEEDDITLPLMLALERLSPLERAAFLLHDVFGESFEAVAATIGRDAAACRQLAARARTCATPVLASSWRRNAAFNWRKPSSRPRAAATWRH